MKHITSCLALITLFTININAQNPTYKLMNDLNSSFYHDYSSDKTDSIIQYSLVSKTKKTLTFKIDTITKSIKPHLGKYSPIDLKEYNSLPKLKESDVSFLFRTRDLMDSMKQFPITAVTKMLKYKDGKETGGCTATFINERFLITAAHCFYNSDKVYPDKIELKVLFDNGSAEKTVTVKNVYHKKNYREHNAQLDGNSYDIGLIEIEEPLGKDLGYLGLLSQTEMDKRLNSWQTMYGFSYPHISFANITKTQMENEKVDSLKKEYKDKINKWESETPDFNKNNQYFEVISVFLDDQKNYKYTGPYEIAGKSGSAKISAEYYLYGVVSAYIAQFNNTHLDIMLRNEILNSYIQIMNGAEN